MSEVEDTSDKWIITCTTNVDQYCNIHRQWRADKKHRFGAQNMHDMLIVNSGTDGISICTKTFSDNHAHITPQVAAALSVEISKAIEISREAKQTASEFWAARNYGYSSVDEIRARFGKK